MALQPVPDGHLAAVVTHFEMRVPPHRDDTALQELTLVPWEWPDPEAYRALFLHIGAPWLWFSRLEMPDAALTAIIYDADVHIFAIKNAAGRDIGMVELDYRTTGECEIVFLGLVPESSGQGHGRALMAEILRRAWGHPGMRRVWLHSCSLDHPRALQFYMRSGFTAFARETETFPDPRLTGLLPRDCAPHVPLIESIGSDSPARP